MNKKTKKFSYLLTFLVAGVSLLAGMVFINPAKSVRQVSADDNEYYLTGTMNNWDITDTTYHLTKIGDTQFKYEGLIADGAAYVKFKVTRNLSWGIEYNYSNLDEDSKQYFYGEGTGDIEIAAKNTGLVLVLDTSIHKISASYELYTLDNIVKCSTAGVNPLYMRVWLDRGGYESAGALNALQFGAAGSLTDESTIYEASGYKKLFEGGEGVDHWEHWLAYFDIPIASLTAGMDVRVIRLDGPRTVIWNKTAIHTWSVGDNNKVLYVGDGWDGATLTTGIISDDKEIPAAFAKHVLEGYLTCLASEINGYGAFPEMSRTFFKKDGGEFKIVGLLDEVDLDDYGPTDTTYAGSRVVGVTDAYTKYQKMEVLYLASLGGSGAPGIFAKNNSITIVILISVIGITSLAALYFLRKKKIA